MRPGTASNSTPERPPADAIASPSMRIGVPRETAAGERRVAVVPELVGKLVPAGFEVLVQRGAGAAASFPDAAYEQAGARLVDDPWSDADAVVKGQKPPAEEGAGVRGGPVVIRVPQPPTHAAGNERPGQPGGGALANG